MGGKLGVVLVGESPTHCMDDQIFSHPLIEMKSTILPASASSLLFEPVNQFHSKCYIHLAGYSGNCILAACLYSMRGPFKSTVRDDSGGRDCMKNFNILFIFLFHLASQDIITFFTFFNNAH